MLLERYLAADDFTAEESWRLLNWCRVRGADEFTLECLGSGPRVEEDVWRPFERLAATHARPAARRRHMSGRTAEELVRDAELWTLNDETIRALHIAFPAGILEYRVAEHGWFEDLILYRGGELMLGIITHESSAVLRVTEQEAAQFAADGFPSHDELPWIGY